MYQTKEKREKGITLVALVITIVVLLILAGITITYVLGDNSIFKKASDAKLKTDIAKYKEMLETAKAPIIIKGLGILNPERYFEYIEEQGIIEDKEKDVVDNEDGTYDITTKPGYIFEVELMPTKEKPTDAEITYLGQKGKIVPIIKKIEVTGIENEITAKATVSRLGNGIITYYYKLSSAEDSTYKEMTNISEKIGAIQTEEIVTGETYTIKVVAKNDIGEAMNTATITVKSPTVADLVGKIQTSTKEVEDENGNKVVIPGGFKVIADTTDNDVDYTYAEDKKPCVQDGIVIEDEDGNQFVWIPIGEIKNKDNTTTTITLGRYTFDTTDGTPKLEQNADSYSRKSFNLWWK